ncbi:MAG: hypothetical protein HYU66_11155, partial [Armatimonadetes bacterium]|nr:hypothetical protein [Armatimonadota bacterium]
LRPTPEAAGDMALLRLELSADELTKPHAWEISIPLSPAGQAAADLATALPVGEVAIVVTRHSRLIDAAEIAVVVLLLAWVVRRRIRVG